MEKFYKTSERPLTGIEKVAILLAEIGPAYNNNYESLMDALALSDDEKRKIRLAYESIGQYAPARHSKERGMYEIKREQSVLEEVIEFGKQRGLFHPVEHFLVKDKEDSSKGVAELAKQNPEAVAKILASWIGDE